MKNNFDFNSKKYTILLILVLLTFSIFVIKMFDYIPTNNIDEDITTEASNFNINFNNKQTTATSDNNINDKITKEENSEEYRKNHKSGHIDFMPKYKYQNDYDEQIDEIKTPDGANEDNLTTIDNSKDGDSDENKALNYYLIGQKFKSSEDYTNAIKQFQQVIDTTSNNELKAMSYEAIAEIYAKHKRYDTALSFANEAYNLSPSNSRKILISRIQYMAGDTENSIRDLNTLLQKGL